MTLSQELLEEEHRAFAKVVDDLVRREFVPAVVGWETAGIVDRDVYVRAAEIGMLGFNLPAEHGGADVTDFRYNAIVTGTLAYHGVYGPAISLHNDIVAPYLLHLASPEQQARWFPPLARGEELWAIAMTEPGTGSDLRGIRTRAERESGGWRVRGTKTFISNGIHADHVIVVARTGGDDRRPEFSLLVVDRGMPGFDRGQKLEKIGLHSQDTAELVFQDVLVPEENVLGEPGAASGHLRRNLAEERLSIAVTAVSAARGAFDLALEYAKTREAFGRPIGSFQHNRFVLAEMATELDVAQTYIDRCVLDVVEGRLTPVGAAKAKWWTTELQKRIVDHAVQLHGGYGYMREYPVARAYVDARAQTIYGGTTEIMKEIIGRDLGV